MKPSGYTCPHCGQPIPLRSFHAIGPFEPKYCPSCGRSRRPEWYEKKVRFERIGSLIVLAVIVLFVWLAWVR